MIGEDYQHIVIAISDTALYNIIAIIKEAHSIYLTLTHQEEQRSFYTSADWNIQTYTITLVISDTSVIYHPIHILLFVDYTYYLYYHILHN